MFSVSGYGHDPKLPTALELGGTLQPETNLDTYKGEVAFKFSEAWKLARNNIKKAQQHQKQQYDRKTRLPRFEVGDRVFLYMPAAKSCKAYKFAKPFHGPYRIVEQNETGVAVWPVDQPQVNPIRVAYNRIRCCAGSIPDLFWPIRSKVSQVASKRQARTTIDKEAMDTISGDQSVSSKQNMNEVERMTKKEVQKNLQAD